MSELSHEAETQEIARLKAGIAAQRAEGAALRLEVARQDARRGKRNTPTFEHAPDRTCIEGVMRAYQNEGRIGQMVRHYYYKLRTARLIVLHPDHPKSGRNAYGYVSKLLTKARQLYKRTQGREGIPFSAVIDEGRRSWSPLTWDSLEEYLRLSMRSYLQLDSWRGQARKLEIWTEKEGLFNFLQSIAEPYRIPVHVAKGYSSTTVDYKAAQRFGTGKGWTLLYVGDFDPTGVDIDRKLQDELRRYGSRPQIERIALTLEQAQALPVETQERVKSGESRGPNYIRTYGLEVSWEIEALPAHQLRDTLLQAIADNGYDFEALKTVQKIERAADEQIEDALRDVFGDMNTHILAEGLSGLKDVPLDVQRRYLAPVPHEDTNDRDADNGDNDDVWQDDDAGESGADAEDDDDSDE